MTRIIYIYLTAFVFTIGCSSTSTVTMSVLEPAYVTLPPGLDNVGVMNRGLATSGTGIRESVNQVFSMKSPEMDKQGAAAAVNGLAEELQKNSRFSSVTMTDMGQPDNPASGVFPAPLAWERIDEICTKNELDGLFSLEFYDTASDIDYNTQRVTIKGPLGVEIPGLEHRAEVRTTIKTGWRIYDNTGKNIIDEFVTTETVFTAGRGVNPVEAVKAVTGRTEAVQTVSGNIGRFYGRQILPNRTRVRRDYYVRGNNNFKIARRRAQTGNWDGAAELWLKETQNRKSKIAGRAHYNMAIINEINGDLDVAVDWASLAYEDYGDRNALRYLRALRNRQAGAEQLRRQNR